MNRVIMPVDEMEKGELSDTTNCVVVGVRDGKFIVGDDKNPDGPQLVFSLGEAEEFIRATKAGEFDHLLEQLRRESTEMTA